ncbi:hypothetical protein RZS08_07855, partial [Arthrospira platensis SPKY1]|nr:hypothetical protein [Arthrospira platensis SPKY1]
LEIDVIDLEDAQEKDSQGNYTGVLKTSSILKFVQNSVLENQSYDMTSAMLMALDMATSFSAKNQTKELMEALTLDAGKQSYGADSAKADDIKPFRNAANFSQDSFKRLVVFGKRSSAIWGNISRHLEPGGTLRKLLGNNVYTRNLTKEEKKLLDAYEKRLAILKKNEEAVLNSKTYSQDVKDNLLAGIKAERDKIDDKVSDMGARYYLGALFESLITKVFIYRKMAYNYVTALWMNR